MIYRGMPEQQPRLLYFSATMFEVVLGPWLATCAHVLLELIAVSMLTQYNSPSLPRQGSIILLRCVSIMVVYSGKANRHIP